MHYSILRCKKQGKCCQFKAAIEGFYLDIIGVINSFLRLKGIVSLNFCCILLKRRLVYSIQKIALETPNICVRAPIDAILFYQGVRTCRHLQVGGGPLHETGAFLQMVLESGIRPKFD